MTRLTVILPVYNAANYLLEAMESLLAQSYSDFAILAVDDGSTDGSLSLLQGIADPRLTVLANEKNLGLVATLNRAARMVKSPFVARMDADDVSKADRFELQLQFLETHPDVGVLGTWAEDWATGASIEVPVTNLSIKTALLSNSALIHPSVMMRTELLHEVLYSADFPHAEDYKLWVDLSRVTNFYNLPLPLLRYRAHPEQVSSRHGRRQQQSRVGVIREYLGSWLGHSVSDKQLQAHLELIGVSPFRELTTLEQWAQTLRSTRLLGDYEARFELESFLSQRFGELFRSWYGSRLLTRIRRKLNRGRAN